MLTKSSRILNFSSVLPVINRLFGKVPANLGIRLPKGGAGYELWVGDAGDPLNVHFVDVFTPFVVADPLEMDVGESSGVGQAENEGFGRGRLMANLSSGCMRH